MSTQPTAFGRKLPFNDWEGDDFTPGAGGDYVTCIDTAGGDNVAWSTNGRVVKDGRAYRAAVKPPDPNGISLPQLKQAIHSLTGLNLVIPTDWSWGNVSSFLMHGGEFGVGGGLIGVGRYDSLERAYRYQANGNFQHGMFFAYRSLSSGIRTYDPLNPDIHAWGRWIPAGAIRTFLDSGAYGDGHYQVAYVPLQSL